MNRAAVPHTPLGLLLLEDSPTDSRLLVESLREAVAAGEVTVQTVRRLADALNQLRQFSFSCVLVDLGLPDAEGTTPVRRIREADPGVAIVVLSGRQDDRVAGQALALGAQDYRVKGQCWGEDLLHVIRRAIDRTGTPSQASQAQAAAGVAGAERGDPGGRTRVALTALERVSVISNR